MGGEKKSGGRVEEEKGKEEKTKGIGRKKENLKDMVRVFMSHRAHSAKAALPTCKAVWG